MDGVLDLHFELFLNYLRPETSLIYPVNDVFLAYLCGVEIDFSFSF